MAREAALRRRKRDLERGPWARCGQLHVRVQGCSAKASESSSSLFFHGERQGEVGSSDVSELVQNEGKRIII